MKFLFWLGYNAMQDGRLGIVGYDINTGLLVSRILYSPVVFCVQREEIILQLGLLNAHSETTEQ